jgi:hypothetical protein
MEKYNLNKLIKVVCCDFAESGFYEYKKEIKFLGIIIRKQGFYYNLIRSSYEGNKEPKNHTLINGIVYENPEVRLYFESGHVKINYFKELNEAKAFARRITSIGTWI